MELFHFTSPPFTREVRIDQRIILPAMESEISALKEVVEARQSAVLVAPAGCGKTVALRALKDCLPAARYSVYYLKLSNLSARDMCRQVAQALGLIPQGQFPALAMALEERLRRGYEDQGLRQVLIFHFLRVWTFQKQPNQARSARHQ
jgi:type II secretory pathway predicted ATPase ExeA